MEERQEILGRVKDAKYSSTKILSFVCRSYFFKSVQLSPAKTSRSRWPRRVGGVSMTGQSTWSMLEIPSRRITRCSRPIGWALIHRQQGSGRQDPLLRARLNQNQRADSSPRRMLWLKILTAVMHRFPLNAVLCVHRRPPRCVSRTMTSPLCSSRKDFIPCRLHVSFSRYGCPYGPYAYKHRVAAIARWIFGMERTLSLPQVQISATRGLMSEDKDVVIHAYTGSGKTLAFLLPLIAAIDPDSKAVQVSMCPNISFS